MRPEELVWGARQDVRVQPVQVERTVLREVHTVDGRERSGGVHATDQLGGRRDGADGSLGDYDRRL